MRSTTLPTAPPKIQASANANSFCSECPRSSVTIKMAAPTPMAVKNQRCQPDDWARNENAAPVLCTRTTLKKLVT